MGMVETAISYTVSVLTIIAFLFQFHKTIMHKDASGISYISQTIVALGVVLWLFYSGGTKNIATGIVNTVVMIPVLITLYHSLKDNGVSTKIAIGLPIVIGIAGLGAFIFFILAKADVIGGNYMGIIALVAIFIGGTFTATAFIPQTFTTLKTRNVKSLSFGMTLTYSISQVLWVTLFSIILARFVSPTPVDTATNIWSVVTAVIPMIVQFSLLYAIIKWGKHKK